MTTIALRTRYQGDVVVHHDGEAVTSVVVNGDDKTDSYLGGAPVLTDHDADTPDGIVWPMTVAELEAKAYAGGTLRLFADDLYRLEIVPAWYDLELETASEAVLCPPWQMAEDVSLNAGEALGATLVDLLLAHVVDDDEVM